ncbi:MAG: N-6 DNA methylase [bacterium]
MKVFLSNEERLEIVKELKQLCSFNAIKLADLQELQKYKYNYINEYLHHLEIKVKPETAINELIQFVIRDLLRLEIASEVNFDNSFIDVVIYQPGVGNPVLLELKPLFVRDTSNKQIKQLPIRWDAHQNQIQKYLKNKSVEFIILTNLKTAYFFNREALIDFKPFKEVDFTDFLVDVIQYDNLWDTIRRVEDDILKIDLDKEFFESLQTWFNDLKSVKLINDSSISREELIVMFLNKFIFIKTLEDFGLINYKHIQEEFEGILRKWEPKGNKLVFQHFFHEIESFFNVYYNTELFKTPIWDYIDKAPANLVTFREKFERILGLDSWSKTYGKGLVHFNYRKINEDIFGKAYETWIAKARKDEGIYYTPATITDYMTQRLVDTLFKEPFEMLKTEIAEASIFDKLELIMNNIRKIRIIDPTSGSGSFLIKVFRKIYVYYLEFAKLTDWIEDLSFDEITNMPAPVQNVKNFRDKYFFQKSKRLQMISSIILNHIFASDKDERALETAKTNLWKEAIKIEPRNYNYIKLTEDKTHILPDLELNFIRGDALIDNDFEEQISFLKDNFTKEIKQLISIRNEYIDNPFEPSVVDDALEIKKRIKEAMLEKFELDKSTLFFPMDFFFCFFDESGKPLAKESKGFSAIISNPPWEAIKPVKKEFAQKAKYEMDVLKFNTWFDDKLKNDEVFREEWGNYCDFYTNYTRILYEKYEYQSSGDPNYYKFFMERDLQLIKPNGYFCLLVPSGFQTDEGSNKLRRMLIEENRLIELSSFENKGYYDEEIEENKKVKLFPDVHPQFKFSIVFARKEHFEDYSFKAKFYLQDPVDLYNDNFISYNLDKIKKFSPENLSIMEFQSDRDYELCLKILSDHKLLGDLEYKLRAEFHMTNDSNLFVSAKDPKVKKSKTHLKLFEGKMIHQFTSNFSEHRYVIDENEAREVLMSKVLHRIKSSNGLNKEDMNNLEIPEDLILDYQTYRLVYRAIGSSTNERSLICSIVPKDVFIGHSMNHLVNLDYVYEKDEIKILPVKYEELVFLMVFLNSLTLNFYIRNKISANLTMNFIYELPIAGASEEIKQEIIAKGFSLLYRKSNKKQYNDLKKELNVEVDESKDLAELRAELEVLIARDLYGLNLDDWKHLTSTFTFGGKSETKQELDEIIKISCEIWE